LAAVTDLEGDRAFYQGDTKAAHTSYQRALDIARHARSREDGIRAQFNLARLQMQEGDTGRALVALHDLAQQANVAGLKYLSLESSLLAAQGSLRQKKYSDVEREARRVLAQSEPQSLRLPLAAAHDLLGNALRSEANPSEAAGHFRYAVGTLDEIKKDPGAEKVFERADLKLLYADVSQAAGSKN
jgi:tetratricopeptide (TPR) repeat protein